ncbi:MAG: Fic family protein [Pseudomonadota bacterium]
MLLHLLTGTEKHPAYENLEAAIQERLYAFLYSTVDAAVGFNRPFFSHELLKAFNFHAIACLHTSAGQYRPIEVKVGNGDDAYYPPSFPLVQNHMEELVDRVNLSWHQTEPFELAAYVLWAINFIHPFINGNGRTARAACYYILCVKVGGHLPGKTHLQELLGREYRSEYVAALHAVDSSYRSATLDISPLRNLIEELFEKQLASA